MSSTKVVIPILPDVADFFYYDETSPTCLRWKIERRCGRGKGWAQIKPGDSTPPKVTSDGGYLTVYYNGKNVFVHRIIYTLHHGQIPDGLFVDHINRIRTDNRIENLRLVTRLHNNHNKTKRTGSNTDFLGVYIDYKVSRGKTYKYYRASAVSAAGEVFYKSFSVLKHGDDIAFELAKQHRTELVIKLNSEGCEYPVGERNNEP